MGVFCQRLNQSEHEAEKITSGVMRMSEASLNVPWHREQNTYMAAAVLNTGCLSPGGI